MYDIAAIPQDDAADVQPVSVRDDLVPAAVQPLRADPRHPAPTGGGGHGEEGAEQHTLVIRQEHRSRLVVISLSKLDSW